MCCSGVAVHRTAAQEVGKGGFKVLNMYAAVG